MSGLDAISALSSREQFCAMFSCAAMFQEAGGAGGVCVFPRLRADIQKKGKSAPLDIQTGGFWAQNSSQEVHVCKNSTMRFSCTASLASVVSLLSSYFKHELLL